MRTDPQSARPDGTPGPRRELSVWAAVGLSPGMSRRVGERSTADEDLPPGTVGR